LNAIFGKELDITTAYSITCYARLPSFLAALMGVTVVLFGDVERFNPQNPMPTNVAFFLNAVEVPKVLYSLASSVDIFTIWFIPLLGVGFSEASGRKVKAFSIFGCFAGFWVVWVLIKVGFSLLT
jgi:hypothetical protein